MTGWMQDNAKAVYEGRQSKISRRPQLAADHLVLRRLIEGFDLNWNKYRNYQK